VAAGLGLRGSSDAPGHEVVFIDPEQIIEWDPDILFLDAAGRQIWEKELQAPSVFSMLKAVRAGEVYTVLPYNWNSTNYENLLCNIWYIGSVLMPGAFYEADVEEKCREVFHLFYGVDIYDQTIDYYRPFRRYMPECVNKDQS
jgi:iron complex transport system substrate-binding protein